MRDLHRLGRVLGLAGLFFAVSLVSACSDASREQLRASAAALGDDVTAAVSGVRQATLGDSADTATAALNDGSENWGFFERSSRQRAWGKSRAGVAKEGRLSAQEQEFLRSQGESPPNLAGHLKVDEFGLIVAFHVRRGSRPGWLTDQSDSTWAQVVTQGRKAIEITGNVNRLGEGLGNAGSRFIRDGITTGTLGRP